MKFFATEYTIHFDDTMAYGSHHFLTAFKFQCAARESFLFGEQIFDVPGVREALNGVRILTADAYSRNLNPAKLGDRIAILLTLEEWQRVSARFCYRVVNSHGQPICGGFQSLICADVRTGKPTPLPPPLWDAMEKMREIEEPPSAESFRDRVLAGGHQLDSLFTNAERETAIGFLAERYPSPQVIGPLGSRIRENSDNANDSRSLATPASEGEDLEAWVFAGQGALDPHLLSQRVVAYANSRPSARDELHRCTAVAGELIGGDASALVSGSSEPCRDAIAAKPELSQVAIHLQNVLGGLLRQSQGYSPGILMGHSFGEIAALGIGGSFDLPTGVRIVCERVRAIAEHAPPGGGLLVVSADRSTVATEAALASLDQVVIAGRNNEQQTVVSGPRDQLEQFRDTLQKLDINAVSIPSPTAFHHPRLRPAALAWREQLTTLPLTAPSLPVYSPIGRRFVSPKDDIAATLASQFLRPFDLQGAVADLIEAGATKFVDCGSSGSLARIIAQAGPEGLDVCGVELEVLKQSDQKTEVAKRIIPPVAVVGQGCILPGGACSPERLYSAIIEQRTGIVDQRHFDPDWSEDFYSEELAPDRTTSYLTGRVNDSDIVAPAGIDADVFKRFTRAQQLLCVALATCIASLEGADRVMCLIGATADGFEDQDVVSSLRFAEIDPTDREIDERLNTARSAFQEPHDAVQEVFDCVVRPGLEVILVDAACASSLYAVALGMRALESNKTDAVIAGGVFCPGPGNSCLFSQFRGTTSTGLRPFDANADGVVFSEGSALVTLRRADDAQQLGLPISAVLRGAGLSSDGRSSSANVPQTHGQILSLERCYASYGIDRSSLQAVEAHGTSTPVGDATELETLRQFFAGSSPNPIPVHSLKGLLGHAGWAAGTASVIAVCQYMRNGLFPAQAGLREPSQALTKSSDTLTVPIRALPLRSRQCRIAIDGFGFGGANAHVVLDNYEPTEPDRNVSPNGQPNEAEQDDDLVFVAHHQIVPTRSSADGSRFDRGSVKLSQRHILLPDLVDDMDISQTLAISLVDEIIEQIPQFDGALQRETSVVLAQSGKTQRGVEATMRVLAQRLRRNLAGLDQSVEAIQAAEDRARPSGPYTLQCMMPNVAAGRAALQRNLNGPNLVVDAGANSLESAMACASLLLQGGENSGTKLVIVTTVAANPWRTSRDKSNASTDEFAAAFAVTTRGYAEQLGLDVVADVAGPLQRRVGDPGSNQSSMTTAHKARALLRALDTDTDANAGEESSADSDSTTATEFEFPVHASVWVEVPLSGSKSDASNDPAILALTPDHEEHAAQLVAALPRYSQRYLVVVVGTAANQVAHKIGDSRVISVDLANETAIAAVLARIDDFSADVVVASESITSWHLSEALTQTATDNSLCEFLFLVCQRNVAKLKRGALELWGLFLDAWNGTVHPKSGAVAGLLKSVKRECERTRTGVICTRGFLMNKCLESLLAERSHNHDEQELVYDGLTRLARRLRQTSRATTPTPQVDLDANSVVVATGGARGVTAVMLEALLRDYQCTVVAFGRSSLEPGPTNVAAARVEKDFYHRFVREHPKASAAEMKGAFERARARWEAHQTVEKLSSLGGRVEYIVADVTNREQVAAAVQQTVSKYGRIDLLIHGAGVQTSKRLEHRSLDEFRKTLAVKVAGLRNLVDHCREHTGTVPSTHVLTSAYSIFGNDGQHDYGAANETLDRVCGLSGTADAPSWSSIAWLAWDGIGMTRGSEYHALAKQRGLSGLTAENGQRIFRAVLGGQTSSKNNVPMSGAEHVKYNVKTIPMTTQASAGRVIEVSVELSKIDCLPYHKVRNAPTLPGAWILERMAAAALQLRADDTSIAAVTIQDVTFHRFVRCSAEREPNIRVVAEEADDDIVVWMVGDVLHPTGAVLSKDQVYAQATLRFEHETTELKSSVPDIGSPNGHGMERFANDPYCNGGNNDVVLSGPFDCVRDIAVGPNGRRARFVPNQPQSASDVIPALLLDSACRVGAMHAAPGRHELCVPMRIRRLVAPIGINALAASTCEIRSTRPTVANGDVRCGRTEVLSERGTVSLLVEDVVAKQLQ